MFAYMGVQNTTRSARLKTPVFEEMIPRHQWTNGGKDVLILRYVDRQGKSYGGFQHPLKVGGSVTAPDWDGNMSCGGGIHGWPWGFSIGDGKEPDWTAIWMVYAVDPKDIVGGSGDLVGKCKFRTGVLKFIGNWQEATAFVLGGQMAWVHHAASGAASATGWSGAASATGARGAASATGAASSAIVTGLYGRAKAGEFSCIALAFYDQKRHRSEMRCAIVGNPRSKAKLKADTWYRLDSNGRFVEDTNV
jgi:hypothetical protein